MLGPVQMRCTEMWESDGGRIPGKRGGRRQQLASGEPHQVRECLRDDDAVFPVADGQVRDRGGSTTTWRDGVAGTPDWGAKVAGAVGQRRYASTVRAVRCDAMRYR